MAIKYVYRDVFTGKIVNSIEANAKPLGSVKLVKLRLKRKK